MGSLLYSINVTLDGCCDHTAVIPDEDLHRHAARNIEEADALIFGRITYGLMEDGWRELAETGTRADWMAEWMEPFAHTIAAARKYVVSDTLERVDWNAEIIRGRDLESTVRRLKAESRGRLLTGGVTLPLALARLGLIDEYEFNVQPRLAGHGPTLLAGLADPIDLKLVGREELGSGSVALRYEVQK